MARPAHREPKQPGMARFCGFREGIVIAQAEPANRTKPPQSICFNNPLLSVLAQ